jgi:hypothetical protein
MVQPLRLVIVLVLAASAAVVPARTASAQAGGWSNHAAAVPQGRVFQVPSPDRKKVIVIAGSLLSVREGGATIEGAERIDVLQAAEVLWAPDSRAFTVTASDGSAAGGWDIGVFVLEHDRCNYYTVTDEALERFRRRHGCGEEEPLNVGAVKWIKDAKQLLVVVESPPAGACRDRGAYRGYVVDVPSGRVSAEHDRGGLQQRWGESLGPRFSRTDEQQAIPLK